MADDTQTRISRTCSELEEFLKSKNQKYGDSAVNPIQVFCKKPADDQILSRIDDKLSRVQNSDTFRKNDIVDLAGYLVLFIISRGWDEEGFSDLLD